MSARVDVAVVGGGIVGLAVARALATDATPRTVRVLEARDELGSGQTGHNSGVVHAGIYYAPGSQKARLCVEGARELWELCDRGGIPSDRCGKLIVARTREELPALDELERRGRANGVAGLRRLAGEEIPDVEPHCRGVAALHSPATGIVDFRAVTRALAAEVEAAGGEVHTGTPVEDVATLDARFTVVCAGSRADVLAERTGGDPDPRILPFRGSYVKLSSAKRHLVRGLIYPVPDPALPFLGVHLTRHVDGEVSVGPTALLAPTDLRRTLTWPGSWRMARRWWRTGLGEMATAARPSRLAAAASEYVAGIEPGDLSPYFAGTRAQAVGRDGRLLDDFAFSEGERVIHVRNAPSPAATASLAIGRLIAERVRARIG